MLITICKLGGGYLAYEIASTALLAAAAWGLGFNGI